MSTPRSNPLRIRQKDLTDNTNCPFHLFKIRFYGCNEHGVLKEIETALKDAGALVQEFKMNYKSRKHLDETAEWAFTCPELEIFMAKFSQTKWWKLSNYAAILTGSLSGSAADFKAIY